MNGVLVIFNDWEHSCCGSFGRLVGRRRTSRNGTRTLTLRSATVLATASACDSPWKSSRSPCAPSSANWNSSPSTKHRSVPPLVSHNTDVIDLIHFRIDWNTTKVLRPFFNPCRSSSESRSDKEFSVFLVLVSGEILDFHSLILLQYQYTHYPHWLLELVWRKK